MIPFIICEAIPGYDDMYVIFRNGDVISFKNGKVRKLKPWLDRYGYYCIALCKDGVVKHHLLHRLVAQAFIPNPLNKPCIDHKNHVRDDKSLTNLKWVTVSENNYNRTIKKITKGGIGKLRNSWQWQYRINNIQKTKTMKNRADLEKYRDEQFAIFDI